MKYITNPTNYTNVEICTYANVSLMSKSFIESNNITLICTYDDKQIYYGSGISLLTSNHIIQHVTNVYISESYELLNDHMADIKKQMYIFKNFHDHVKINLQKPPIFKYFFDDLKIFFNKYNMKISLFILIFYTFYIYMIISYPYSVYQNIKYYTIALFPICLLIFSRFFV